MKRVPSILLPAYRATLRRAGMVGPQVGSHEKWLRYYLDFCFKYKHPPRDPDSLDPYMQKLAAKNQSAAAQEEAAGAIKLYYTTMQDWQGDRTADGVEVASTHAWDALFAKLKDEIRLRQYSPKTLSAYRIWTEQFRIFLNHKPPEEVNDEDATRFLTYLATNKGVVASTQNQAFNALLFVFRHILKVDYDLKDRVVRARRTRYIPVVLTREEVDRVLAELEYPYRLVVGLLYGCGLRLFEGLNLRVGCLNLDEQMLTVHDGKGKKDRTVPLPEKLIPDLRQHLERVCILHERDLASGYDGVFMPGALDRKWKNASKELVWQWVFPAKTLTFVPDKKEHRRYRMHESVFQRAFRAAVRKAKIPKRVTAHTMRHSFASHLLRNNYDIRTIQEMLGHSDVRTTMIYTHTVKSRTQKERKSPLDFPAA